MSWIIKVNKIVVKSNVLFDCEIDSDLEEQIDEKTYSTAKVKDGAKVTYTITADGYLPISNTVIADKNYELTPELKKYVTLIIKPFPETSKVVITYEGKDYEKTSLNVLSNTEVKYTVSKDKYETISETVMLNGDKTIDVELNVKINGDMGIGRFEGRNSDGLANINLMSEKEYNKLTEKQRSNYVRFDPWLTSYVGTDVTKAINDCLVDLYWSLPIVKKLAPFTHGTMKFNGDTLLTYIGQLNSILQSAQSIGDQLKRIQKAANKVGLGSIVNIFTMAFKLIGGLAGMIYSILYNPQILLRPYAEMFKNYDLKDLYDRTIGTTIPNLEYAKANLNRIYFPDGDLKNNLFGMVKKIDAATGISANVLETVQQLGEIVDFNVNIEKGLETTLRLLSTMGLDWALGELAKSVADLKLEYDDVSNSLNNNALSLASEEMMKNINGIMNELGTKYIRIQDLEYIKELNKDTKNESLEEYLNGYNNALINAQNGETEEQMDLRLLKYKTDLENQNQDPTSYIDGYKKGWQLGQKLLDAEKKNLNTQERKDSYKAGYDDGYEYGLKVRDTAYDYLSLGKIYGFIDIDSHIHNYNYQPIGRIDGDKVLSFPDEQIIGSYDSAHQLLKIYNIEYFAKDNIIINTNIQEEISEDDIENLCNYLYKLNLIMVERGTPRDDYINPYYASGWNDGYKSMIQENNKKHESMIIDDEGEINGYNYASGISKKGNAGNTQRDDELFNILDNEIENYKTQHPSTYYYYAQGIIRGANNFQSEYNDGYSGGWWSSMIKTDYDIYYDKNDYRLLSPIITNNNEFKGYIKRGSIIKDHYERNYQILGYVKDNTPYNFNGEEIGFISGTSVYKREGDAIIQIGVLDMGDVINDYDDNDIGYANDIPYNSSNTIMGYINSGKLIYLYDDIEHVVEEKILGYVKRNPYNSSNNTIMGYIKWDETANKERIYQNNTNNVLPNQQNPYYIVDDIIYNSENIPIGYVKEEPYNFSNVLIGIIDGNDVKKQQADQSYKKIGEIINGKMVYSIGTTSLTKDNPLGGIINDKIYNSNTEIGYVKEEPFDKNDNKMGEIIPEKKYVILKEDHSIFGEDIENDIYNNDQVIAFINKLDDIIDIESRVLKEEKLSEYCEDIGTTIEIQESKPYIERDGRYRGWDEGWNDKLNGLSSPDYKQMYYNNNY